MIVDRHHDLALAGAHELGHLDILVEREIYAVALGLPILWVAVKEGVRAVVALHALQPC